VSSADASARRDPKARMQVTNSVKQQLAVQIVERP
jgi:hypothetical protein